MSVTHLTSFAFLTALISSSAFAATPHWQSPYIGVYAGGALGNNHPTTTTGTVTSSSYFTTGADINAVNNAGSSTNNSNAPIAGVQMGHDWVWKQLVYGVAFDYGVLPLSSTQRVTNATYPDNSNNYSIYTSMSTNWLFTLRGRLGYQTQLYWPSLLYVTSGMAITQLKVNNSFSDNSANAGTGGTNAAENKIGWTAGVGLELASFEHASVDFEYLYVQVPSVRATSTISNSAGGFGVPVHSLTSPFTTTGQFYASLFKIEFNYRFDE